jgi:hypothetical protein
MEHAELLDTKKQELYELLCQSHATNGVPGRYSAEAEVKKPPIYMVRETVFLRCDV